ncbi:MAG: hypothetical protein Q7S00_02545, partial [bacterium]|nr:hypothetical protein [bacterium]
MAGAKGLSEQETAAAKRYLPASGNEIVCDKWVYKKLIPEDAGYDAALTSYKAAFICDDNNIPRDGYVKVQVTGHFRSQDDGFVAEAGSFKAEIMESGGSEFEAYAEKYEGDVFVNDVGSKRATDFVRAMLPQRLPVPTETQTIEVRGTGAFSVGQESLTILLPEGSITQGEEAV